MNTVLNPLNLPEEVIAKLPIYHRVRAMVFIDDDTLACVEEEGKSGKPYVTIPGGGVEEGEDNETAVRREVREETGYDITDLVFLGYADFVREIYRSRSAYYIARTLGNQNKLAPTENEIAAKIKSVEVSLKEFIVKTNTQYIEIQHPMMLRNLFIIKEVLKKKFVDEGFKHVYEWHDEAGTTYPEHAHKDKVSIYITQGEVTFTFIETDEVKKVSTGERFDVPIGKKHTAIVGKDGCSYIVGEMIEGDS